MVKVLGTIDDNEILNSGIIIAQTGQKIILHPLPQYDNAKMELRFIDSDVDTDASTVTTESSMEGELVVLKISGHGFANFSGDIDISSGNTAPISIGEDDEYYYGINYILNVFGSSETKSIAFSFTTVRRPK